MNESWSTARILDQVEHSRRCPKVLQGSRLPSTGKRTLLRSAETTPVAPLENLTATVASHTRPKAQTQVELNKILAYSHLR